MRIILIILALLPALVSAQMLMPPGTPATPGSACGAPGVGFDPVSRGVVAMTSPNYRVDERGNWAQCDRPCLADSKPREWTVDGHACTTAPTRHGYSGVDDPRLDRALRHGTYGSWRANDQRGLLIEKCDDGERTVVYSSCSAPPAPPASVASAPAVVAPPAPVDPGCGRQTLRRGGLTAVYPGPVLTEGASSTVRLGLRYVPVWCRDGRLTFDAPVLTSEQAASAAKALVGK